MKTLTVAAIAVLTAATAACGLLPETPTAAGVCAAVEAAPPLPELARARTACGLHADAEAVCAAVQDTKSPELDDVRAVCEALP